MQSTKEINLKSFKLCGLSTLEIKYMNDVFVPLGEPLPSAKSCTTFTISSFIISQQSFIVPKLDPSYPRVLTLSHSKTTYSICSSIIFLIKTSLSYLEMVSKCTWSNRICMYKIVSSKLFYTCNRLEINLKSFKLCGLSTLEIKYMNDVFVLLGEPLPSAKSCTTFTISSFIISQQSFIVPKLNPSYPRV